MFGPVIRRSLLSWRVVFVCFMFPPVSLLRVALCFLGTTAQLFTTWLCGTSVRTEAPQSYRDTSLDTLFTFIHALKFFGCFFFCFFF